MKLSLQTVKIFTTELSKEEVINFVRERLDRKKKVLFIPTSAYAGSIDKTTFYFYKTFNGGQGPANPKIKGTILTDDPTTIEIKISPHYARILFFLIFPCVFIPGAILSDQMTINGILREPELLDRVACGLFGGGGPMIWCYFDSIRPIKQTERWITEKLKLKEKSPYQF